MLAPFGLNFFIHLTLQNTQMKLNACNDAIAQFLLTTYDQ